MRRLVKLGIGTLVALGLVAGTLAAVFAADPTPTPAPAAPGQGTCVCPGGGLGMRGGFGAMGGFGIMDEDLTKLLGMTADQIHSERLAGKSLAQIAQSKGITKDKLVETILADRKAALDQAVKNGRLTQAQADTMLATMKDQIGRSVDDTTVGPRGPRGGGRGMWGTPAQPNQQAPVGPRSGMRGGRFGQL